MCILNQKFTYGDIDIWTIVPQGIKNVGAYTVQAACVSYSIDLDNKVGVGQATPSLNLTANQTELTGDGSTLSPQGQATRAQAAVMLMRFCEKYVVW